MGWGTAGEDGAGAGGTRVTGTPARSSSYAHAMPYSQRGMLADPAYRREKASRAAAASHDPHRILLRITDPVAVARLAVAAAAHARELAAGTEVAGRVAEVLARISA